MNTRDSSKSPASPKVEEWLHNRDPDADHESLLSPVFEDDSRQRHSKTKKSVQTLERFPSDTMQMKKPNNAVSVHPSKLYLPDCVPNIPTAIGNSPSHIDTLVAIPETAATVHGGADDLLHQKSGKS